MVLNYIWIGFFAIAFLIATIQLLMGNTEVFPAIMNSTFDNAKTAFEISLGLTGVLPIMVSVKQRNFYMLAALPFFALALAHLSLSMLDSLTLICKPHLRKWMTIGASCVFLIGLSLNLFHIGKYGRDEAFLKEMKTFLIEIPENEIVAIVPEDFSQWTWHAYFMRYGKVSLDCTQPHDHSFSYHP